MIYSLSFLRSNEMPNLSMDTIAINLIKKQEIQHLKESFDRAKLNIKDLKWLDKNNRKQVEWAYKYKLKLRKKDEGILPKLILIHADSLSINSGDTDLMYNHIVASFDFHFYKLLIKNNNNLLSQGYEIVGDRSIAKVRNILINRMRNAWYKEVSRESPKKSSNIKYNISTESRKILKEMVKNQKKSEVELLEYIIEDYAKSNRFIGIL